MDMTSSDDRERRASPWGSAADSPVRLEDPTRLSESMLWDVQHAYWERGSVAFASGDVPFLLSTAPVVAHSYARLIEGFIEDVAAGRFGDSDPSEPVYVVDIGCGNGRLGYYVLRELDQEHIDPMRVVYVFSDRARANVDFCDSHPRLARYFESGQADIAQFDAETDRSLILEKRGVELQPSTVANPIVAIASYLFCAIPQDVFSVIDGRIYEEHVEVIAENGYVKPADATFFDSLFVARYHVPFEHGRYEERLDEVVNAVAAERGPDHQFLFPPHAIRVLDAIGDLSRHRSLVIVADRPETEPLTAPGEPRFLPAVNDDERGRRVVLDENTSRPADLYGMDTHGSCISLPVDFGVLAAAARLAGGEMLGSPDLPSALTIRAFVEGEVERARAFRKGFREAITNPSPDDLWYTAHLTAVEEAPLQGLLADLRVSGYDPDLLMKVYPGLQLLLREAPETWQRETLRVLDRVYDMNYRVSPTDDIAFGIAILLAKVKRWREAIIYFDRSKADFGPRPQSSFNAAVCHLNLGARDAALAELDAALALDGGYKPAREMRERVLAGESFD